MRAFNIQTFEIENQRMFECQKLTFVHALIHNITMNSTTTLNAKSHYHTIIHNQIYHNSPHDNIHTQW